MKIRPGTMRYDMFVKKKRQIELHLIFFSWSIHLTLQLLTRLIFLQQEIHLVKQRKHELKYNHS